MIHPANSYRCPVNAFEPCTTQKVVLLTTLIFLSVISFLTLAKPAAFAATGLMLLLSAKVLTNAECSVGCLDLLLLSKLFSLFTKAPTREQRTIVRMNLPPQIGVRQPYVERHEHEPVGHDMRRRGHEPGFADGNMHEDRYEHEPIGDGWRRRGDEHEAVGDGRRRRRQN